MVVLVLYWFVIWGIFNLVLRERNYGYSSGSRVTAIFFLISALIPTVFLYQNYFYQISLVWLSTIISLSIFLILYRTFPHKLWYKSMQVKSLDVCFQQIIIFALIQSFSTQLTTGAVAFGIFFGLIHIPIVLSKVKRKYLYLFSSFIGGFVFYFLIINYDFGVVLSYIVHVIYYVLILKVEGYRKKSIEEINL